MWRSSVHSGDRWRDQEQILHDTRIAEVEQTKSVCARNGTVHLIQSNDDTSDTPDTSKKRGSAHCRCKQCTRMMIHIKTHEPG